MTILTVAGARLPNPPDAGQRTAAQHLRTWSKMLASGRVKVAFRPNDIASLFQDSAGTTPVTAMEQPVGLILDKSQGLVLGPELVANGTFDTSSGWNTPAGWAVSGGVATASVTNGSLKLLGNPFVSGRTYRVQFDYTHTSGLLYVRAGTGTAATFNTSGTKTAYLVSSGTTGLEFYGGSVAGSVDNVSVKELLGNHASQVTSTKRVRVSWRVNLVTESEFRNGVSDAPTRGGLVTATTMAGYLGALAFGHDGATASFAYKAVALSAVPYTASVIVEMTDGLPPSFASATATNGGNTFGIVIGGGVISPLTYNTEALGGGRYRVTCAGTGTANVNQGIIKYATNDARTFKVTAYDLRLSIDAHLPYQWVNTATDYDDDPNKFPAYFAFDGVDDALSIGNIDFTSTDKVTVFAGVTKLSDAARGLVVGLGNGSIAGSVFLQAPFDPASPSYLFQSMGSTSRWAATTSYPSPSTGVLTGISDISGDHVSLRVNASVVATTTTDQGTGNYGSYPLYIGAAAGTANYFNGRLYGLIVLADLATADELAAVEYLLTYDMRLPA